MLGRDLSGVVLATLVWLAASGVARAEPQEVHVGLYLANVNDIDLKAGMYTADFYIWLRWKGPIDPVPSMEFMNMVERWGITEKNLYEEPLELPSGERYQLVHVQGKFNNKFPLHSYPLDNQDIIIDVEDLDHTSDQLVYRPDRENTRFDPDLNLPGWTLLGQTFRVFDYRYPTSFGLPPSHEKSAYSRLVYRLHLGRPVLSYTLKMLLPVLIVLCSNFAIFWLAPSQVDSRISLAITALLSAVALNITVVDNLPLVGYQVLVDKIYNLTYLVVFLTLVATIWAVRLDEAGEKAKALRVDSVCCRLLPALFLVGTLLLIVTR